MNVFRNHAEVVEPGKQRFHLVQFGNNSMLIKSILRQHFAWLLPMDPHNEFSDFDNFTKGTEKKSKNFKSKCASAVHLVWTQYKIQDILDSLKANKKFKLKYNSQQHMYVDKTQEENNDGVVLFNHFEKNVYLVSKRTCTWFRNGDWRCRCGITTRSLI